MERLQKILAHAGIASRRKCEELIVEGRVTVDGQVVTELGVKVDPKTQAIMVDGVVIERETRVCIMLYKPTSWITSSHDPEGRRTVVDLVKDVPMRVYPVGRLDYDTSGLLLLSNDGDLTERLLHPSHHIEKTYRVTVRGMVDKAIRQQLESGVTLEDGKTAPAVVHVLRGHPVESVVEMTIYEGRNRQIRRTFEALELPVKRLKRLQFGPLELSQLRVGEWRYLTPEEWTNLYTSARLTVPPYTNPDGAPADGDREKHRDRKPGMKGKPRGQTTLKYRGKRTGDSFGARPSSKSKRESGSAGKTGYKRTTRPKRNPKKGY